MEIIIVVGIAVVVYFGYKFLNKENPDGSHPLDSIAPYKVEPKLTTKPDGIGHESVPAKSSVLDVNQDGKVDMKDAVEAVKKTKTKAKKVAEEVATEVKTVAKKTAAKAKKVEETVVKKVKKPKAK